MIFQDLALWPHMTALGNLVFAARGMADSVIVMNAGRVVHTWSGGEFRALCRAEVLARFKQV